MQIGRVFGETDGNISLQERAPDQQADQAREKIRSSRAESSMGTAGTFPEGPSSKSMGTAGTFPEGPSSKGMGTTGKSPERPGRKAQDRVDGNDNRVLLLPEDTQKRKEPLPGLWKKLPRLQQV